MPTPNYTIDKLKQHFTVTINELLPTQSGNSGKFLTTNGETISWATVDALPSQTGQSGKFLTTNGTTATWETVDALPSQTNNSGKYLTTNGSSASWGSISYTNLTDKPDLTLKANVADLATVATSGSYNDLSNTPTIPTVPTNVSSFTNDSGYITGVSWDDISDKPSTFTPAEHDHDSDYADINHNHDGVYAPLASPALTGTPTAPTATAGDNSTQIATTAYVDSAVSGLVDSAPTTLDTLNELAAALGDDPNFATTVATSIGEKLDSNSANYVKSLSISGTTITVTKGDNTTSTLTTQDTTYSLPEATTSTLGGVIVGNGLSVSSGTISADDQLPSQTGNSGKYLTTNGTTTSWSTVDALPAQTGNNGKYLTTNGSIASWVSINEYTLPIASSSILGGIKVGTNLSIDSETGVLNATDTVYTHPTTSGNKHIPSGGSTGQFLKWSADGTATWAADNDTTYSAGDGLSLTSTTFSLDTATASTIGGVKIGSGITITDGVISADSQIPTQTNNGGKYLTTDGSALSWATVDALPSQTNNSGKFLTTNGTTASWATIFSGEVRVSSTHHPTAAATTIVLTTVQVPENNIEQWGLSVYRDGIYLIDGIDYTYASNSRTLTFTRAFEANEVVSVNFAYLSSDSGTSGSTTLPTQTGQSGKFLTTNGTDASWSTLPIATTSALGAIKVGTNLSINSTTGVLSATDQLPTQTNNSGKFLTTNGSSASWSNVDSFPTQTGNNGKYLTTNGTSVSWATIPTYTTFVGSGASAASGLVPKPSTTTGTTKYLREDGSWEVPPNDNTVTTATTSGSGNAVTAITASNGALTVTKGSTFVDLSSDQTIGGIKSFTSNVRLINIDPGEDSYAQKMFVGYAGDGTDPISGLLIQRTSSGLSRAYLRVWGNNSFSDMGIYKSSTGTVTTYAPTPNTSDNSTQIATTAFVKSNLSNYAPLASPALTGTPTAPTATQGDNSTQIATTAYVDTAVSNLVNSAPTTLDTLAELSAALGDDPNFATTVATNIGNKLSTNSSGYIKSLSISGKTITYTKGDNTTGTLTTQDTTYIQGTGITISNGVISADNQLPTQTNNSGKFLTTNGTTASWATVDALPSQSGNSGKYLTTNGSAASWATIESYTLPTASDSTLGGIKVGTNLSIDGNGVLSATDTVYTHPTTSGNKHIPSGGSTGQFLKWSADGTAVWAADNNTVTTVSVTGSGNAITNITDSNGALTATKGNTFVDLESNQTITGSKTFTKRIIDNEDIVVKNTNITRGNVSTEVSQNQGILSYHDSSSNNRISSVYSDYVVTDSNHYYNQLSLLAYDPASTSFTYGKLGIGYNQTGAYTFAPTPANDDNSTQIATTAWVNSVISRDALKYVTSNTTIYVATTATGTADGSSAANAMNVSSMWKYLATVHASGTSNSYTITVNFAPGSYGNISFDKNKMPGVRYLTINTSTGANSTLENYTTNTPVFAGMVFRGSDLYATVKNVECNTITAEYGAYVLLNTYVGAYYFVSQNWGYLNFGSGLYNIKRGSTNYLAFSTTFGLINISTNTVNFHFREQCYYNSYLFGTEYTAREYINYGNIKFTGIKPIVATNYSGTLTGTSSTESNIAAKEVTLEDGQTFTLANNATAIVQFTNDNTADNPTLNIAGTGAKPIYYNNNVIPGKYLNNTVKYAFKYDSTNDRYNCLNSFQRYQYAGHLSTLSYSNSYNTTYRDGEWNLDGYTSNYTSGADVNGTVYGAVNGTSITQSASDNSTKIATTAFVKSQGYTTASGHNHDSAYLKLTGGTITGDIVYKSTAITRGTAPSSNSERVMVSFRDSSNAHMGGISNTYYTDKSSFTGIWAYNTSSATGNSIGRLGIGSDESGNVYTIAPTPPTGDVSTKIATTEFISNGKANVRLRNITSSCGSTNNYPYHRIATASTSAGNFRTNYSGNYTLTLLVVGARINTNALGLVKITLRTNAGGVSTCNVNWAYRTSDIPIDTISVGFRNTTDDTIVDVFNKLNSNYLIYNIKVLHNAISADSGVPIYELLDSNEVNSTTSSDKLTSTNVYASIEAANTELYENKPYTSTITPDDRGIVDVANKLGTTDIGSATQPIYLDAGVPTATTYTLGKSVPADAVFTDTVYTHPTTSGNKHIPSGGSSGQVLVWSSDGTATWGNASDSALPSQTGNSGKYLTTNGTSASWVNVDVLPAQTNNAGKFLTTDGTDASWSDILDEIKVSSIHYPTTNATTIVLTEQQAIPSTINKYAMTVYRDGIYLNPSVDYGYNSTTRTLTFTEAFDEDEVVTVVFTYVTTDSQVTLDLDVDEYEAGTGITFTPNAITNKVTISADSFPTQTGNSGKYLTTDGTSVSWGTVESYELPIASSSTLGGIKVGTNLSINNGVLSADDQIPSQANNSGKYLTTNGTSISWGTIESYTLPTASSSTLGGIKVGNNLSINNSTGVLSADDQLPSQSGNSGKFLTTNGSAVSWATVDALPSQTGNSGKFLTTNGTTASWVALPVVETLTTSEVEDIFDTALGLSNS